MEASVSRRGDRRRPPLWRRVPRWAAWTLLGVVVLLVGARIALDFFVEDYVNRRLNEIPGYRGHVEDIRIHLYRGAYAIEGVRLDKTSGEVPVPLFSAPKIEFSVEWRELLRGAVVVEMQIQGPEVNFVQGPSAATRQTEVDSSWVEQVKSLYPFSLNRLEVRDGTIHYRDFHSEPKVDIHLDQIQGLAQHLTNRPEEGAALFASVHVTGRPLGHGLFRFDMKLDPLQEPPPFSFDAALEDLRVPALNDFLRAYGKFDAKAGTFSAYMEIASEAGRYQGYVKPFFKDLEIPATYEHKSLPGKLWSALVSGAAKLLENRRDEVATRVPISGTLENPEAGIFAAVGGLLRNAFIQAFTPGFEGSIGTRLEGALGAGEGGKAGDEKKADAGDKDEKR